MREVLILGMPRTGSTRVANMFYAEGGNLGENEFLHPRIPGCFSTRLRMLLEPSSKFSVTKIMSQQLKECVDLPKTLLAIGSLYNRHILTVRRNSLDMCLSFLKAYQTRVYNSITPVNPSIITIGREVFDIYERDTRYADKVEAVFVELFHPEVIVYEDHMDRSSSYLASLLNLPSKEDYTCKLATSGSKLAQIANIEEVLDWYSNYTERHYNG